MVSSASSSRFRFLVFCDDDDDRPSIWPLTKPFKRARFENVSGARFSASATKDASRASPLMGAEDRYPLGRGKVPAELAQPLLRSVEELLDPRRTCCERCPAPSRGQSPRRSPPADLRAPSPGTSPWGCFHPPKTSPGGAPRAGVILLAGAELRRCEDIR